MGVLDANRFRRRHVLEAVLWILNTGAQWHMLPQSYPNYKTVHRRFQTWCRNEILRRVLTDVANELRDRGVLDEEECFIDATFVMAKGGGAEIGPTKRGKGLKIMAIVDRHGLPLSVSTHAANHHEVRLVQLCFDFYMIEAKPENLIGDRAYDSDPLDEELRQRRHRDDRAAPFQSQQAAHARSATAKPLHAALARRALLRLDTMAASHPRPLGVPRPELPRLCPARLPRCPLQTILRLKYWQHICLIQRRSGYGLSTNCAGYIFIKDAACEFANMRREKRAARLLPRRRPRDKRLDGRGDISSLAGSRLNPISKSQPSSTFRVRPAAGYLSAPVKNVENLG